MKRNVYDGCMYYNEDMLLKLRLDTLWNHVDVFVVVEGTRTTTGIKKPLYFDQSKFSPYSSKLRYLVHDSDLTDFSDFWLNERLQRDHIGKGFFDAAPDDLLIVSDVDEIPRPQSIKDYDPNYLRGDFEQDYFAYFFNNKLVSPASERLWYGSKITTKYHFDKTFRGSTVELRSYRSRGLLRSLRRWRFNHYERQLLHKGGWHFTWIGKVSDIQNKMNITAHQELNTSTVQNPDWIKQTIVAGRDVWVPGRRYLKVCVDASYPAPMLESPEDFVNFMI